jgi:ABC-type lipoprotein export system ATPase subunit
MTNTNVPPLIVCENLVKIYKVADLEVVALQGLDLIVQRGEMLGIVGASGSGKSTLMNTLGGLDHPSAGRVTVDGVDLLTLNEADLNAYQRAKVGFVWQQTSRNLIPYLTALENIELPMTMAWNTNRHAKREWAEELLNSVGLYERRFHKLSQLSGGEQQRIAIAVGLANKPVLLLGDEPTGEVDSVTAQSIMNTFRNLRDRLDLTIIIVTHDPRIAEQVDRVVAIRDGKISTETIRQVGQLEKGMAGPKTAEMPEVEVGGDGESSQEQALTEAAQLTGSEVKEDSREHITLQEFVVLDSAGRLQIPKDYLQRSNIKSRVTLEVTEEGILIRSAGDSGHAPSAEALGAALAASKRTGRSRRVYGKLLDRVLNVVNPNRRTEG